MILNILVGLLRNFSVIMSQKLWIGHPIVQILTRLKIKGRVEREINKLLVKKKPVTTDCFREIIQKEWEGIETEIFVNLVRSMSRRLEDVIAGNGNKINY